MVGNTAIKIIFVSSGQYPDGGAATNRHLAYAKGLVELGLDVEFLLIKRQNWNTDQLRVDGIKLTRCDSDAKGIQIPKLSNLINYWVSIQNTKKILTNQIKGKNNVVIILLDTLIMSLNPIISTAKKHRIKILHERTEYPFIVSKKSVFGRINLNIYLQKIIKRFDGIFVINKALRSYFLNQTDGKVPVKIINMIVDPSRFECSSNSGSVKNRVITFCGGLDGDKDGVPILIRSFAKIQKEFPDTRLQLIGSLNNGTTRKDLKVLISSLKIDQKVILTGSIPRNEVPRYLCESSILALARPSNKQAEGGFPTKLGEYLATGNPVVVTKTGEIGEFIRDGINAFLSEPDSVEAFADKLKEALTNRRSAEIGLKGRELVYRDFNYLSQAKELLKFIKEINGHE